MTTQVEKAPAHSDKSDKAPPEAGQLAVIVASGTLNPGTPIVSAATAYATILNIRATCTNGATLPPSEPAMVTLSLTADGVRYFNVDTRWFGVTAGVTYTQFYMLENYDQLVTNYNVAGPWTFFKITFFGNAAQPVTVAANSVS